MLKLAYILLFIILFAIILYFYNSAIKKNNVTSTFRKKKLIIIVLSVFSWLLIHYMISLTGFYNNYSTPRVPLFMVVPLFLFTAIFLFMNKNNKILSMIPIHIPIAYQSFRLIIELLFYFTFLKGILPIQVTFEGANYDVLLGFSAIFFAIYAYKKPDSKKLLIAWNLLGIGIVLFAAFTFISSFYYPSIWGEDASVPEKFIQFPFLLLPSFFMPSAIFMHVLSIVQLNQKLK
jgi:hypothetical protein